MFERFVKTFPDVNASQLQMIKLYYELLVKWNKSHNLVQKNTLSHDSYEMRHLIDCWQLTKYLNKSLPILDVGSGAGLPGILLAIAGFSIDLVEIDHNKASFLKNCKTQLGLSCSILCDDVNRMTNFYPQITSRAFASLSALAHIQSNVSRETIGHYLKGKNYKNEISEARQHFNFTLKLHDSLSSDIGKIVIIKNVSRETIDVQNHQ
jgi:16S rRNA (guanine527-N7)-methyltransferase